LVLGGVPSGVFTGVYCSLERSTYVQVRSSCGLNELRNTEQPESVREALDREVFGFGGSEAGLKVAHGGAQVAEVVQGNRLVFGGIEADWIWSR
jgi:hypothetical protein